MNFPQLAKQPSWDDIHHSFKQMNSWEERYRQLLLLGKQLTAIPAENQDKKIAISGCESKTWFYIDQNHQLWLDSEARIIRGIIIILLTLITYNNKDSFISINLIDVLDDLGLKNYISHSRINGINSIWNKIIELHSNKREADPNLF
ncbi:MAG: Sulfur acceptor protein CsdE [Candidatus Celerinatantimonas neptuna]|nr:MAG: Sulfur acceptor protein CsdE [Candidatus Celerinatantimonas neptuna]